MRRLTLARLVGHQGELSAALQWRLVEEVFGDRKTPLLGTFMMVTTGALAEISGGPRWLAWWTLAAVVIMLARLRLARAFALRDQRDAPATWARRYCYGAWAVSALWGGVSVVVLTDTSGFLQFLVITAQSGLLIGAAVANSAVPQAAIGQSYITLCPLILACLLTGRTEYQLYSVLSFVHLVAAQIFTLRLCRRAVRLLLAEEGMAETCARLAEANGQLASLALIDGLTGVPNRRALDEALAREWRRAQRDHQYVSLVLFDVDHFKLLNDTQGHLVGDDFLRRVALCLRDCAQRPTDIVARFGGEEFAVLLADTDAFGAALAAERMRHAVEKLALPHPASPFGIITVSGGVMTGLPAEMELVTMLDHADKALYAAKASGRNRVRGTEMAFAVAKVGSLDSACRRQYPT